MLRCREKLPQSQHSSIAPASHIRPTARMAVAGGSMPPAAAPPDDRTCREPLYCAGQIEASLLDMLG